MDSVNARYGGVWKLLTDYNFDSNKRCYPDLICVICNKLLRNAHQNECGCRYCLECIQLYSQSNDKPCPGKTEECNEKIIDLVNDIQEDYTANKKISMIMVTCPILNCQYTDYLMNMEEHIHSHQVECPYIDIGCEFHRDIVQNVNTHLNQESYAHSKLISGSILELKINLLPMIEKLHKNHAEELNEYFFNAFKEQEEKIVNLQSENEKFRKQLENIFNQSHNSSISNDFSSAVTEDLSRISNCPKELNGLEKIVTTITINNNSAHLENINCLDDMQTFENKFSNFKSQTDSELSNHKEIHKKLNDDIKLLQISCKSLSKSKDSYSHSSSSSSKSHGHDLQKYLDDYRYEMDKMQTTRRKSEKTNDEMKRFYEKFHMNIDEVRQRVKRMQRDIDRIERNSCIEDIEKFNKILKDYFSDSEKLHEKVALFHDDLEKSKRDNEKVLIKCHTNQKELLTVKESLANFQVKNDKISNDLQKINKELIGIKQKTHREHNANKSRKRSDSGSSSFDKIIDSETYKTVIDNLQLKQKMFIDINDDEMKMNGNLENIVENVDSIINSNNNSPEINQREIMNYSEICQFNNRKETESNFDKINEDIIAIKLILNAFQLENSSTKTIYENIKEQQLKINNRLVEIDRTINENSIDHNNTNDLINKTIKEIIEMKTSAEKYQNDTNSTQLDIQKSNEKLFLTTEDLKRELETCWTKENRLQTEHNILNQEINRIKLELKNNSTDIEGIKYFFVGCENRFENIKNDVAMNYNKIEMLKSDNADSWESIKRIGMDLEKLSKDMNLIHKFNEDFMKMGKQKSIDESNSLEIYIDKLKEENLKMETENNNKYKTFRKNINCNLKDYGTNIKKLSDKVQILERKSDESHESIVSQNSRLEQCNNGQIDLKKNFENLSKLFRNLKTECLNRRSDLRSSHVIKKPNNNREWVVENFHNRSEKAKAKEAAYITSEWFQFADYKVGFKLFLNGDKEANGHYLSIFCFIKPEEKSMPRRKLKLTICLVDRATGSHSVTKEYEYYNFIKQEESSEESVINELGSSKFISLDNLFSNSTYIKNDSILFRFNIIPFNQ